MLYFILYKLLFDCIFIRPNKGAQCNQPEKQIHFKSLVVICLGIGIRIALNVLGSTKIHFWWQFNEVLNASTFDSFWCFFAIIMFYSFTSRVHYNCKSSMAHVTSFITLKVRICELLFVIWSRVPWTCANDETHTYSLYFYADIFIATTRWKNAFCFYQQKI